MNKKTPLNLFFTLFMLMLALVYCLPIILILMHAFTPNPSANSAFICPDNFMAVWQVLDFTGALLKTILLTAAGTAGIILMGSMAAYALQRIRLKICKFIYPVFIFSLLIPLQTLLIPLVVLAKSLGINSSMGFIFVYWGMGCPLAIFIMHGFIKNLPADWEAAAALDGADFIVIFFHIVFPLLGPIVIALTILNVFWIWNDFLLPFKILPLQATIQLAQYSFFKQFSGAPGPAAASLALTSLPVVVFYLVMQKHMLKGIKAGVIRA